MKFGLSMFGLAPRHYPDIAAAVEENGFESVWMPEHLVFPAVIPPTYLYSESGYPPVNADTALYDPWVVLGAVAHATSSIRLATNVFILPLRHPIQVARSVMTLDRVSNGRVTLGMGVGWLEEEFVAMGQSFADRGKRADEMIGVMRRLWTEDTIEHHGETIDFGPVKFQPKPVQKAGIPIEVGGTTKPALRRAGRLGDGWIELGSGSIETLKERLAFIEAERKAAGRQNLPFEVTSGLGAGSLDNARRAAEAGVTRIQVGPTPNADVRITIDTFRDFTKKYADEVISKI